MTTPTSPNPADQFVAFCFRCFAPLKRNQVAATYHAHAVMWNDKAEATIDLHACDGCKKALDEAIEKGIRGMVKEWDEINTVVVMPTEGEKKDAGIITAS